MYYLVSKNDEYLSMAIHTDVFTLEGCQDVLKSILICRIQELFSHDVETANAIYETAKAAETADDEDAVLDQYNVDIHVFEDGASIVYDSYEERYAIIDYTPCQHI